ncbi:MAG: dTMP kinase [Magnetococcales bacterium]|nr:dTMP kinase [Magnetococcales bacterium]
MSFPGRFITFEGGEGAGKSTQIERLARRLRDRGLEVVSSREPGGSPLAEEIRHWVVRGEPGAIAAKTELLLMLAARVEHVQQRILPALQRGAWVLCDRFVDSTWAYQGYGRGMDLTMLHQWHHWTVDGLLPDRTLLLDLDPVIGLQRAGRDNHPESRFEQEALAFHQRVRQGFLCLAQAAPDRYRVLVAAQAITQLEEQIWMAVHDLFPDP